MPANAADLPHISVPVSGGRMRAALALPENTDGSAPGVLVLHELFGLNDDIRGIAARFADNGYVALAPDLHSAHPPLLPKPICMMQTMRSLLRGNGRTHADIAAAQDWLAARAEVDASRMAVAGFCMGGGFAILHAARAPVGAAAAFYGAVPREAEALDGICPTFAGYGELDTRFASQPPRLERRLTEIGVAHEVIVYPGAGHSYMNRHGGLLGRMERRRGRMGYHEASAEDSWSRMLAFFDTHLNAPPA